MSIFDKDIRLPIDHLYDECKDVCKFIVPTNMMHYRADKSFMKADVVRELKYRGLYGKQYPFNKDNLNKICRVECSIDRYTRLIPRYRVWFYYNSSYEASNFGDLHMMQSYLCDFVVGINGIIDEHI